MLDELNVKFLMPAIQNKRIKALADQHQSPTVIEYKLGVRRKRKSGRTWYRDDATWFNLVIVTNEDGIKRTFATNLEVKEEDAFSLFDFYEKRWGIETSYRVKNGFRVRTTSKNYVVRLFYFLLSTCLYNLWVLANIAVALLVYGKILGKPLISAKVFGTILCTARFMIDNGG